MIAPAALEALATGGAGLAEHPAGRGSRCAACGLCRAGSPAGARARPARDDRAGCALHAPRPPVGPPGARPAADS